MNPLADHLRQQSRLRDSLAGPAVPAVGGLVVALLCLSAPGPLEAQTWSDFQASRQLQAEESLSVDVTYGAGRFVVTPGATGTLYQVRVRYDEGSFQPVHRYENGRLELSVSGESAGRRSPFRRGDGQREMEIRLSREVTTDLKMELGAVQAELDLGGLRLRSLSLATGASDTHLRVSEPNPMTLPQATFQVGAASFRARELGRLNAREVKVDAGVGDVRLSFEGLQQSDTRVAVSMGLGSVEIEVPADAGIRLTRSTFLTSVNAPGLTRRGDAYESDNWGTADRRMTIRIDAALGSINVRRINDR